MKSQCLILEKKIRKKNINLLSAECAKTAVKVKNVG